MRESRFRELRNERIFLETSKGGWKYDVRSSLHDRPASAPSASLLPDGADDEFLAHFGELNIGHKRKFFSANCQN